jgi:hypothetical protein
MSSKSSWILLLLFRIWKLVLCSSKYFFSLLLGGFQRRYYFCSSIRVFFSCGIGIFHYVYSKSISVQGTLPESGYNMSNVVE